MTRTPAALVIVLPLFAGCLELDEPRDVAGAFDVTYEDNLRVYIGDDLVADVVSGEDATIEWGDGHFSVSQICSDEGTECPAETFWRAVNLEQPHGTSSKLFDIVNDDLERGEEGDKLGAVLDNRGGFGALSGLALGRNKACTAIGVSTVEGAFNDANDAITDGIIAYEWGAGCTINGVKINANLRLETDYTADRAP